MFSKAKQMRVKVYPIFRSDAINKRALEHFILEHFRSEDIGDFKLGELIYVKVERVEPAEAIHTDRHTMLEVVVQDDGMDLERFVYQGKDEGLDEELISSNLGRSYLRLFREGKEPWKKILLTGEPGTGKTFFAHELLRAAQERGLKVYAIPASMFVGEFVGDTIRVVNAVKKGIGKDCMLFIDDCDLLLHTRNDMKSYGALLESVVAFLNFIDEFEGHMVAASNDREIDPAIENRMFGIRFDLPRHDMLMRYMAKTDPHVTPREAIALMERRASYRDAQKYLVLKAAGLDKEAGQGHRHDPLYR
ncbi:MAG: Proteasome-activating nucleotidase [Methanomassiliicoccales archaeon PtaU1.Bin124]|nr:MAG: Proteasome-activating nucleotidase [Methanomassiliicoccales archaeon PtaU1.Bin124]